MTGDLVSDGRVPTVTVVMPVRDEGPFIDRSVGAVLEQDYPRDHLQLLVADGRSTDGTRARVAALGELDPRLSLVDNPEGIVPTGLNRALAMASGEVVIRIDGHAVVPPDYVRRCVEVLFESDADCAGGVITTVGDGVKARAIAAAQASPFGVGNATFRTGTPQARAVDTLAFGAYRREVFDRIGTFDEELRRNQDDELNYRLTQAGGTIWLDPSIRCLYFSRASLPGAWRQYREYGLYKVRVVQKRGGVPASRQLVPAAFVAALGASVVLAAARRSPRWLAAVAVPYAVANLVAAYRTGRDEPELLPWLPVSFATFHLAYGLGSLQGLWRYRRRWGDSG